MASLSRSGLSSMVSREEMDGERLRALDGVEGTEEKDEKDEKDEVEEKW